MKKNRIYFIIFLFTIIGIIFSLNTISAEVDSSNWTKEKVGNVEFKIPPRYSGGNLSTDKNSYTYNSLNEFGILCLDNYLPSNYGFHLINDRDNENKTIANHDIAFFCDYNKYEKDNVSIAYFSSENSIYAVQWKGNSITPEIESVIASAPQSSLSSSQFYSKLDQAKSKYMEQEEMNSYEEAGYYEPQSNKKDRSSDFARDYVFYKLGQHSTK